MDSEQIERLLYSRRPLLLIDGATVEDSSIFAHFTAYGYEWFFDGCNSRHIEMPHLYLDEMMWQASCLLVNSLSSVHEPHFLSMKDVSHFVETELPAWFQIHAKVVAQCGGRIEVEAQVLHNDQCCASALLTYYFTA